MLTSFRPPLRNLALAVATVVAANSPLFAQTGTSTDTVLLVPSPSSVPVGSPVTLTTTVVAGSVGSPVPTGTVQFLYGGVLLDTETLSAGVASYTAATTLLLPGTYNVTAAYSGDANYQANTSITVPVVIQTYPTTTSLSVPSSAVAEGSHALIVATVTSSAAASVPTGYVTLKSGNTVLTQVPVQNGVATLSAPTAGLAGGVYPITAIYSGDSQNATSTSLPGSVTIAGNTATALSFGTSEYAIGQTAVLTATVAGVDGGGTPTGNVQFSFGDLILGTEPLVSGVATLTIPTAGLPQASYQINATYQGATTFLPSSGTSPVTLGPAYTVTPANAVVGLGGITQFAVSPVAAQGTVVWYVNGIAGGNAAVGTIDANGNYTAPSSGSTYLAGSVTATVASEPTYATPSATVYVLAPGTVTAAANPYVLDYTISLPDGASAAVNFGQTNSYGLSTSSVTAPPGGGSTTVQVAGMIPQINYHFQGVLSLPGGLTFTDGDNVKKTAGLSSLNFPVITIVTNSSPSPGIEMADQITNAAVPVFAFDLSGNVIWAYPQTDFTSGDIVQPIKQLPNGHFLLIVSQSSTIPLQGGVPDGSLQVVREIDLVGNTIQEMSLSTLNANLAAAGYDLTLLTLHHDVEVLPNGHWLVLANLLVPEMVGSPIHSVNVLGDVIVDVDPSNNYAVDWVWNEFDHVSVNRQPYGFPDWTHTNAIVYSPDDGNILVSMRHQNWVVKVNYADGTGDGSILWHMGAADPLLNEVPDFSLLNADGTPDSDPTDWNYAQHLPAFFTPNTTGVFQLSFMDNGTDRGTYEAAICGAVSAPVCYTRAPVFTIDENAMTVTETFPDVLDPAYYSFFGGNTEQLANGDLEYDLSSYKTLSNTIGSSIQETTLGADPKIVWQSNIDGENFYRAFRLTSLYPGITWAENAGQTASNRKMLERKRATSPHFVPNPELPTPRM